MIDFKKEDDEKSVVFNENNFSKYDWENIREKRIFIPNTDLPNNYNECICFLEKFVAYIKEETDIYCSYIAVNEIEPYELKGFYVQAIPELVDTNGEYVYNDSYLYDKDGVEWHVSYYLRENLKIILDNKNGDYQVVTNLSEYSLDPFSLEKTEQEDLGLKILSKTLEKSAMRIAAVTFALLFIVNTIGEVFFDDPDSFVSLVILVIFVIALIIFIKDIKNNEDK